VQDTELGSADVKFPPEIEEQSNQIFRQIYRSELSIPQVPISYFKSRLTYLFICSLPPCLALTVPALTRAKAIQMLKNLKESKEQRDELVFLCIIHNLFDEYRYFPRFPEKELQITGLLFGALIQHQLISYIPLGMALRYVLEALRKPPGSNMFTFGVTALEQFKSRLSECTPSPQPRDYMLYIYFLFLSKLE
jgi:CCR4-NOT transcription complex subunit 1